MHNNSSTGFIFFFPVTDQSECFSDIHILRPNSGSYCRIKVGGFVWEEEMAPSLYVRDLC